MTATQAQRAYQHLRSKLISGDFEPGQRLLYGPIGQEIGISATPVREAVGQLANEGLVELVPQLGAVVRTINRTELIELYEMREAIEPYASARAAERATPARLAPVEAQLAQMRELTLQLHASNKPVAGKRLTARFEKADFAFHMSIIEATGNQTMVRTAASSHVLTRIFGVRRHVYDVAVMQATCADHDRILDAIKTADSRAAYEAATHHIRHGLEITLRNLDNSDERWWNE